MSNIMHKVIPAIFALALTMVACAKPYDAEPTASSSVPVSTTSSSSSSTAKPTSTTTDASISQAPTHEAAEPVPMTAASPTEIVPVDPPVQEYSIFNEPGVGYQCPGTDAFTDDPANCTSANLGGDPSYDEIYPGGYPANEVPFADGGTCEAAICGYGHDENGNPNPSSGELQTMHGCEEGYITDVELCGRVFDKAAQYGW